MSSWLPYCTTILTFYSLIISHITRMCFLNTSPWYFSFLLYLPLLVILGCRHHPLSRPSSIFGKWTKSHSKCNGCLENISFSPFLAFIIAFFCHLFIPVHPSSLTPFIYRFHPSSRKRPLSLLPLSFDSSLHFAHCFIQMLILSGMMGSLAFLWRRDDSCKHSYGLIVLVGSMVNMMIASVAGVGMWRTAISS